MGAPLIKITSKRLQMRNVAIGGHWSRRSEVAERIGEHCSDVIFVTRSRDTIASKVAYHGNA